MLVTIGKHLKIVDGDVATLYAHCNKIYVKEGDNIEVWQEIAEVGATRQCNRATFTF